MKKHTLRVVVLLFSVVFLLETRVSFAQSRDQVQEKALASIDTKKPLMRPSGFKVSVRADLFTGYDSNPSLGPYRKGDMFEEARIFVDFRKPLIKGMLFTAAYYVDSLNYHEQTDVSSILNNLRLGLHRKFMPFRVGSGYNLSFAYYPHNDDGDFVFHKWFTYLGHDIGRKLYHQLELEGGLKDYIHKKAILHNLSSYDDNQRRDKRMGVEYLIGFLPHRKLLLKLKSKYYLNESNAVYQDFYDYKAFRQSLDIDYKLFDNVSLVSNISYIRKEYDSRNVTARDYEQEDDIYSATMGLVYRLDTNTALSVYYTYREEASNDSLVEYSESVITCGWQYKF